MQAYRPNEQSNLLNKNCQGSNSCIIEYELDWSNRQFSEPHQRNKMCITICKFIIGFPLILFSIALLILAVTTFIQNSKVYYAWITELGVGITGLILGIFLIAHECCKKNLE